MDTNLNWASLQKSRNYELKGILTLLLQSIKPNNESSPKNDSWVIANVEVLPPAQGAVHDERIFKVILRF